MLRQALLAGLTLLAAPRGSEIERLVGDLGSDDVAVRDRAVGELLKKGREARPELEAARRSSDVEVAERARAILNRISPLQVLFDFDPERGEANKSLGMSLRSINESVEEAVFYPAGLSSRILLLQLFEEPTQASFAIDCRGVRRRGCQLSEEDFVRIPSRCGFRRDACGWRTDVEVPPDFRVRYPEIWQWTVDTPGRYRAIACYRFDLHAYKRLCNRGCPDHDDPRKLWNRCSTQPLEVERDFVIAVGKERCACGRH